MGSVAISARPVLDTTVSTSGYFIRVFSIRVESSTDSFKETLGRRTTLIATEPSSSSGINSEPKKGTRTRLERKQDAAAIKVIPGWVTAFGINGWNYSFK